MFSILEKTISGYRDAVPLSEYESSFASWALSRPQKFMTFVGIARILLDFEIFQESKIYDRSGNLFVFTQQNIIKSSWDPKYPIPNLMIHLFNNLPAQTGGEVLSSWWYS